MIVSHKNKFVFIKNRKVAGTSMELYLSMHCGPRDTVTVVGGEGAEIPGKFVQQFAGRPPFENEFGFKNHVEGPIVRDKIGDDVWRDYSTFCFDRNPVSKTISFYHFLTANLTGCEDPLQVFFDIAYPEFCSDAAGYILDGRIIVDRVGNYSRIVEDFAEICEDIGLPFDGDLGFTAKSHQSKIEKPPLAIDDDLKQALADAHALEAQHVPWMAIEGFSPSGPAVLPWCEARVARVNNRLDVATSHIDKALEADAGHAPSWFEKANILWRQRDANEALECVARAIELEPDRTTYRRKLATWQIARGTLDTAEATLRGAIALSPANPMLRSDLAHLLARNERFEDAANAVDTSIAQYTKWSPKWVSFQVEALCWRGRPDEAMDLIERRREYELARCGEDLAATVVADLLLQECRSLALIGQAHLRAGRHDQAIAVLRDENLLRTDGGFAIAALLDHFHEEADVPSLFDNIDWALSRQPWHTVFLRTAARTLKNYPDPPLIHRIVERARAASANDPLLMEQCKRLLKLVESAQGSEQAVAWARGG